MLVERIKEVIRDIPDFPKQGIVFKDITPILARPELVREIVLHFKENLSSLELDAIACVESRGFWFGTVLAYEMNLPIVPIRKKGKLPHKTVSVEYDLEYGSETIEAHEDAIIPGHQILIHDDLLATGGTAAASAELITQSGGVVAGFSFLVNLTFLNGKDQLGKYNEMIFSVTDY